MYDPQMIKGEREVLSEKGVKAFNYRTFGGLVLIIPDNSRKSKKRRVKNTKRTKKKIKIKIDLLLSKYFYSLKGPKCYELQEKCSCVGYFGTNGVWDFIHCFYSRRY